MILEIDIGNTRIKWRCLQNGVVQARGVVESGERDAWVGNIRDNYSPGMIRLACVGDRAVVDWVAWRRNGAVFSKRHALPEKWQVFAVDMMSRKQWEWIDGWQ